MTICDSYACNIVLKYIIPIIGNITAFAILLSPYEKVKTVNTSKHIGDLNTIPFQLMILNALGWIMYGIALKDWFVFLPNVFGFTFGLYYSYSTFRYSETSSQILTLRLLITGTFLIVFLSGLAFIGFESSPEIGKRLLGTITVIILVIFYASPLSDLYKVKI